MKSYGRLLAIPAFAALYVACVGDAATPTTSSLDGGATEDSGGATDGGGGSGDDAAAGDGSTVDAGGDADTEVRCGYPGEACCEAPSLPCRQGTTCSTSNARCMVSELLVAGAYGEYRKSPAVLATHHVSATFDGKEWTVGAASADEILAPDNGFTSFSLTDLASAGQGDYYATFFKSSEGSVRHFANGRWFPCANNQPCRAPDAVPAMWTVAKVGVDVWLGGSSAFWRCVSGKPCVKEITGLEGTTWGTGKLMGTASQDLWFGALTRVFQFNGTTWTIHDGVNARALFERAPNDVWVGDKTLRHWDGQKWSDEMVIDGSVAPGSIQTISGSGPNDVWAVGADTTTSAAPAFTAHWDGKAWSKKALPAGARGNASIFAPSPLEAYVAMASGVYRWDGAAWTRMTLAKVDSGDDGLVDVAWEYIAGPATPRR